MISKKEIDEMFEELKERNEWLHAKNKKEIDNEKKVMTFGKIMEYEEWLNDINEQEIDNEKIVMTVEEFMEYGFNKK